MVPGRPGQLVADDELPEEGNTTHPLPTVEDLRAANQRTEDLRRRLTHGPDAPAYQAPAYPSPPQHPSYSPYGPYYQVGAPQGQMAPPPANYGQYVPPPAPQGWFPVPGASQGQFPLPGDPQGHFLFPGAPQGHFPFPPAAQPHHLQPTNHPAYGLMSLYQAPADMQQNSYGTGSTMIQVNHYNTLTYQQATSGRQQEGQRQRRVQRGSGQFRCGLCGVRMTRSRSIYSPHFVRCIRARGGCSPHARWDDDESCWINGGQGEEIPPGYPEIMKKLGIQPYDWKANPEGLNTNVTHNKGPGGWAKKGKDPLKQRIPSMAKNDHWSVRLGRTTRYPPKPPLPAPVLPEDATMTGGGGVEEAGAGGTGVARTGVAETGVEETGGEVAMTEAPDATVDQPVNPNQYGNDDPDSPLTDLSDPESEL